MSDNILRICITNRAIVEGDFLSQIRRVANMRPYAMILREKDLSRDDYRALSKEVSLICRECGVPLILHSHADIAAELSADGVHLPMALLSELSPNLRRRLKSVGASTHSVEEAKRAERFGATYITASHIFETDCKAGLEARGLEFLREVCKSVSIPVFALGGIDEGNEKLCIDAGAAGICMMSGYMKK